LKVSQVTRIRIGDLPVIELSRQSLSIPESSFHLFAKNLKSFNCPDIQPHILCEQINEVLNNLNFGNDSQATLLAKTEPDQGKGILVESKYLNLQNLSSHSLSYESSTTITSLPTPSKEVYLKLVREQLLRIRLAPPTKPEEVGFRDSFGYVVRYKDGKREPPGEATYDTAIAVVALATSNYKQHTWEAEKTNLAIEELLDILLEKSWGNRDEFGRTHPIRHPDHFDYDGARNKIRARPLSKDSFGQILAAAYYAYQCPNSSGMVREKARALIQKWTDYLVLNQWRLHSNYIPGEFESIPNPGGDGDLCKNIFDKDGKQIDYVGLETFLLFPHEIYALQNVASRLGIPTNGWNIWLNATVELKQTIADVAASYIGDAAGRGLDYVLQRLKYSKSYSIQLGPADWNLGKVEGEFTVGIPNDVRRKTVTTFSDAIRDIIRESARLSDFPDQAGELLGLVINRILNLFPEVLGPSSWRSIITGLMQQITPWLDGSAWVEAATFIATLQILKKDPAKPYVISYPFWCFAVEFETRPEMADLLKPFVREFFSFLRGRDNPNGLWAWLSEDSGRIQEQLQFFVDNDPNQWWQSAYENTAYNVWKTESRNKDVKDFSRGAPRLDYLVLEGLDEKGYPTGLPDIVLDLNSFLKAAEDALGNFLGSIKEQFERLGQYAREWLDQSGKLVRELWEKGGLYTRELFQNGQRIVRLINQFGGSVEEWLWGTDGVFQRYGKWWRSTVDGTVQDADMVIVLLRDVAGQLRQTIWGTDGVFQRYDKWWRSAVDGTTRDADRVERKLRSALGQIREWRWGNDGAFQQYVRWWRSAVDGTAQAADIIEVQLRDAAGQLETKFFGTDGVFQRSIRWWRSAVDGTAQAADIVESRFRDAAGQLRQTISGTDGVFQRSIRWWRSAVDGTVQDADIVESRFRNAAGQLEETIRGTDRVFKRFRRWWRSAVDGGVIENDKVVEVFRDPAGQLEETFWGTDGAFQQFRRWWRSAEDGVVQDADRVVVIFRDAAGQLAAWNWGTDGAFQRYREWWRSAVDGTAQAADIIVFQLRDAAGQLEDWKWGTGGAFQRYRKWWRSAKDGTVNNTDRVILQLRDAAGQFEEWIWGADGVFQRYGQWLKSSLDGSTVKDLITLFTQLSNGNRTVETWNSAGEYAKSVFDSEGNWIGGIRIPFPEWPPRIWNNL
jgi:hypothetical protein